MVSVGITPSTLMSQPFQEGADQFVHLLHEGRRDVVEDHACQLVAQGFLHDRQIVVLEVFLEAVDDQTLEPQFTAEGHAVYTAILARIHGAGACHQGQVVVLGKGFVAFPDARDVGVEFAGEGLDLEVVGHDHGRDLFGRAVQAEHVLHEVGVLVAELAALFQGQGAHGFHVAQLVAQLLEFQSQADGDHVFARVAGCRADIQSWHNFLRLP